MKIYFKFKRDDRFNILDHKIPDINFERCAEVHYEDVQKTIASFFKELLKEARNRDSSLERVLEINLANDGFPTSELNTIFLYNLTGSFKPTTVYFNFLKSMFFVLELSGLEVCLLKRTCNLLDVLNTTKTSVYTFDWVSEFLNYSDNNFEQVRQLLYNMSKDKVLMNRIENVISLKEKEGKTLPEKINLDKTETSLCILKLLSSYILFSRLDYDNLDIHFSIGNADNEENLVIKSTCGQIHFDLKPREVRSCVLISADIEELQEEIEEFLSKGDDNE